MLYLLALSVFLLAPAHAQEKTGWGVSVGLGSSTVKDVDGTESFDGSAFGFSIEGEYRFAPYFALGLGYVNFGSPNDIFNSVDTEITVDGFGVFGRLILPVSDSVDLYARIGNISYYADAEPGGSNFFGDDASEFGLGLDVGRGGAYALRIEARHFDGTRDESGTLITAGFSFRF